MENVLSTLLSFSIGTSTLGIYTFIQLLGNKAPPAEVKNADAHHDKHKSRPRMSELQAMFHAVACLYKDGVFNEC